MTRLLHDYGLMLKWQALSSKTILPISLVVQLMVSFGFVIGLGFLYPSITPNIAKFLTTGAPTISLLMMGLVLVPQMVADSKRPARLIISGRCRFPGWFMSRRIPPFTYYYKFRRDSFADSGRSILSFRL